MSEDPSDPGDERGEREWQQDFVAVSATLGEPMSAVVEALGESGVSRVRDLVERLQSGVKASRALALAKALAEVVEDLEERGLR